MVCPFNQYERMGWDKQGIVVLASYKFRFIRVYDNFFCKIQVIINLFLDRYIPGTFKLFILTRVKSWVSKVINEIDGWIDF